MSSEELSYDTLSSLPTKGGGDARTLEMLRQTLSDGSSLPEQPPPKTSRVAASRPPPESRPWWAAASLGLGVALLLAALVVYAMRKSRTRPRVQEPFAQA